MRILKNSSILKIFFIFFTVLNVFIYGNDMAFVAEGNHLIPLETSDIAIKKERIAFKKLNNYEMEVRVEFTFNSDEAGKKIIGFITPPDEYYDEDEKYDPKNIKNFKTKVNGKEVEIKIEKMNTFIKKGQLPQNDKSNYLKNYKNAYVYYFAADFKKGENIVEHSYTYYGFSSTINKREYSYVLTTISRWKNKKVDDFEMTVDMGDEFFALPYTFWKNEKAVNWEIVGEGRKVSEKMNPPSDDEAPNYQGYTYFKIKKGYVKFSAKNFSPDREFYAVIFRRAYAPIGYSDKEVVDGYRFNDKLIKTGWDLDHPYTHPDINKLKAEAEKLSDFELEVIKNFPYAVEGYDFSRKDLKDYFSKFFWYYPKGKVSVPDYEFQYRERIKIIDEILEKRKKRK